MSKKRIKWHSGPPPSVGWWPASVSRTFGILRWWDGSRWGQAAYPTNTAAQAARFARIPTKFQEDVEWTDRPADWPERSKT